MAEQVEESVAVKVRRDPAAPTRAEIEEHEVACHEPYHNWCTPCVAGRGNADPHRGRDHTEDGVITMSIDYDYHDKRAKLGEDDEGEEGTDGTKASPLLCGRDALGWIFCHCLRSKETGDEHSATMLKIEIVQSGETKVLVKSEGELAIRNLVQVTVAAVRVSDGVTVLTEQTPKGESKANGLAEGAVRDIKAKVRTLKCATEKFLGVVIDHEHWSLPFLCKYAGATIVRARRGTHGKTPYERRLGKKWR